VVDARLSAHLAMLLNPRSSSARLQNTRDRSTTAVARVLVVDESAAHDCAIALMLRAEGFEVIEASSAEDALAARRCQSIDAVVLSLSIPESQSFELCRRLKATSAQLLPLLYVSAEGSREARVRALDAGVDGFLAHPIDSAELRASVAALVRLTRQEEQNISDAAAAADADRRRLNATLEALPVGVWLSDALGAITHCNPAVAQIWGGHAPPAAMPDDFTSFRAWTSGGKSIAPKDWSLARTLETGETIIGEYVEIERFDGSRGHLLVSSAPIIDSDGRIIGGVAVNVDLTERELETRERERLVATLEAERSRLATIFQEAPAFLAVMHGPEYVFERINPAYLQLVGHRDPVGLSLLEALPELRDQGFVELLDRVRLTGEPISAKQLPVRLVRAPGAPLETRYVDVVYQRLADAEGNFDIVSHGVDVTDQVLATHALQQSEQRLRDQFAKVPVPTYLWEVRGDDFVMVDCNEAAIRAFPEYGSSAIGRLFSELFPEWDTLRDAYRRCLSENVVLRRSVEFDEPPPGGTKTLDLTIGPQQPDRVLAHVIDTTERVELEAQLRQAQKMDAVGRLAGGIAHDFNNLLTVIGAHSAFLIESINSGNVRLEDAEEIQKAAIRATGLTRQLLAFSRKQILKPALLDLNAIIESTGKMLRRLLGEDIEIVTHLAPDLRAVIADASQLDQVLMNLAVNARDAMPDGGLLTITTCNRTIAEGGEGARHLIPAGDYTLLEMSDTGIGMDAAVRARLFEPFFTTKQMGKGTGLGLATVYGIVKQSAGYVLVDSAPGEGTTFQVYLPASSKAREADDVLVAESPSVRGAETVLIIEDEQAVRDIVTRILKRHGYVVLVAASGAEALALSAAFESTIDLVISDAVMPGMGGGEVVRRLQEQRPGLKALFMSGYTDDEVIRRGIISATTSFIQKPFSLTAFARATRETLDS
jgi:two-component system cell cycle sensor histidine kinase/response regulator CckA